MKRSGSQAPVATRPLNVVVADDDRHDQLLLTMAAEEAGVDLELYFVDDGVRLLALLDDRAAEGALPDLIVLDLRMPRLDGHQVLQLLADDPALWRIPVVVLSSSSDRADIEATLSRGVRSYQTKPSEFSELTRFVSTLASFAPRDDATDPADARQALAVTDLFFANGLVSVITSHHW
jgi:CheY-like chemotaxis protein